MIGVLTRKNQKEGETQAITLSSSRLVVGRDAHCQIFIDDRSVSRVHAAIIRHERGHYILEDQDSKNGTTVNGIPLLQKRLRDRDIITFGDISFDFNLIEANQQDDLVNEIRPVNTENLRKATEQTIVKAPTPQETSTTSAAEAWQIVRFFSRSTRDQLHEAIDQIVHDLSCIVGIRHTLLYLPFSQDGNSRFIRRGDRAGRYFSEERLRLAVEDGQPIGIRSNHVVPLQHELTKPVDAVYIPFHVGAAGRACLYADAEDMLDRTTVDTLRIATEALGVGISLLTGADAEVARSHVEPDGDSDEIIGRSPLLLQVMRQAVKAAATDYPVLIRGETGTGKELLSRLIHDRSNRKGAPHIAVNCGAATEALLMSDLFGHEKGAFTGAVGTRKGHFENATGGTIFLDEIGEAPLPMQAALLRVLQEQKITHVGSSKEIAVDVRIIAATNRNLEQAVEAGTFRRDLLHRLNTVELNMPPLRERRDDIPALIQHFIQRECRVLRRQLVDLAPAALERIMLYDWPGNIREVENAMKWAVTMAEEKTIQPEDLPRTLHATKTTTPPSTNKPGQETPSEKLSDVERLHILAVVTTSQSKAEAARRLGIGRNTLYAKLQEYGVETDT